MLRRRREVGWRKSPNCEVRARNDMPDGRTGLKDQTHAQTTSPICETSQLTSRARLGTENPQRSMSWIQRRDG